MTSYPKMRITPKHIENIITRNGNNYFYGSLYQAALNKNIAEINYILDYDDNDESDDVYLRLHKHAQECVKPCILKLIHDRKMDVVTFLLERTDVKYFLKDSYLSINEIAYYAARHGYREFCESIKALSSAERFIIYGSAQNKDYEYVEKLLEGSPQMIGLAIEGFASVGDFHQAEALLNRSMCPEHCRALLYGAALGGHSQHVELLLAQYEFSSQVIYAAACSAMSSGFFQLGEKLLKKSGEILIRCFDPFISSAIEYADMHSVYVEYLLISTLLNHLNRSNQLRLEPFNKAIKEWERSYPRCYSSENVRKKALLGFNLMTKFPGITVDQVLTLLYNSSALAILLTLNLFGRLKSNGPSHFCQLPYVSILAVFSFIFGAEPHVLYKQNTEGFGKFLFLQQGRAQKMIDSRTQSSSPRVKQPPKISCCIIQ